MSYKEIAEKYFRKIRDHQASKPISNNAPVYLDNKGRVTVSNPGASAITSGGTSLGEYPANRPVGHILYNGYGTYDTNTTVVLDNTWTTGDYRTNPNIGHWITVPQAPATWVWTQDATTLDTQDYLETKRQDFPVLIGSIYDNINSLHNIMVSTVFCCCYNLNLGKYNRIDIYSDPSNNAHRTYLKSFNNMTFKNYVEKALAKEVKNIYEIWHPSISCHLYSITNRQLEDCDEKMEDDLIKLMGKFENIKSIIVDKTTKQIVDKLGMSKIQHINFNGPKTKKEYRKAQIAINKAYPDYMERILDFDLNELETMENSQITSPL